MPTFEEYSQEIVEKFLQTVVVIDDEAYLNEPEAPSSETIAKAAAELKPPTPRGDTEVTTPETSVPRRPSVGQLLDAKVLIDEFALKGLVCAVLRPEKGDNLSVATLKAAVRADILVLDWELQKDQGKTATTIIKEILQNEAGHSGRLRLIAIYTGETDLKGGCYDKLRKDLPESVELQSPDNAFILQCGAARIRLIKKADGGQKNQGGVTERSLPQLLIEEFARHAAGLLPNIAMAAIGSLRQETHRLISRFQKSLDGAFLTHRMLLNTPNDAADFAVELVGDEIKAILEAYEIGKGAAGQAIVEQYIADLPSDHTFRVMDSKKKENLATLDIPKDDVIALSNDGFGAVPGSFRKKSHLHHRIHPLFSPQPAVGFSAHQEFARVSALKREAYGSAAIPKEWRPKLGLGTVICVDDNAYFACLQPLCDCVRLKCDTATPFIFAPLLVDDERFDLVITDKSTNNVHLQIDPAPFHTRIMSFNPGSECEMRANEVDETFVFQCADAGINCVEWIADLRQVFAMRIVHRVSTELSRVGLDEFEWQRKFSLPPER